MPAIYCDKCNLIWDASEEPMVGGVCAPCRRFAVMGSDPQVDHQATAALNPKKEA